MYEDPLSPFLSFFFFSLREAELTRFHFKTTRTHGGSNVSSPFSLTNEWATARSAVTGLMRPVFTPPRPESNTVKAAETHCLLILQLCEVFSKGSWIFPFHFFFFFFSLLLDLIHAHRNSCKVATDLFFFFFFPALQCNNSHPGLLYVDDCTLESQTEN